MAKKIVPSNSELKKLISFEHLTGKLDQTVSNQLELFWPLKKSGYRSILACGNERRKSAVDFREPKIRSDEINPSL